MWLMMEHRAVLDLVGRVHGAVLPGITRLFVIERNTDSFRA